MQSSSSEIHLNISTGTVAESTYLAIAKKKTNNQKRY